MKRKDTLDALFLKKNTATAAPQPEPERERIKSGAISAMGASLQQLTDGARRASHLQQQIDSGGAVVELDPTVVDSGMVKDRIFIDVDPSFNELVDSIAGNGQQVPILVRPIEDQAGRYQVAYGHRRLKAAQHLGIKVKAIVKPMTDDELVIAQGKENLERRDLSYIEKALFARRLEDSGFDRSTIVAALSTDKADLSRYISIARLIPDDLLNLIGPARRIGRSRWLTLAEYLKNAEADETVKTVTSGDDFLMLASDERFARLFKALAPQPAAPVVVQPAATRSSVWTSEEGEDIAYVEQGSTQTLLTIDETLAPEFGAFILTQLDKLYERYRAEQKKH